MSQPNSAASLAASVRLDKWLWAARFYKTRGLAQDAINAGQVRVNQQRVKPAKSVRVGDVCQLSIGGLAWVVEVRALSEKRGSASIAALLYQESAASQQARQEQVAYRRAERQSQPVYGLRGRPTKKLRRELDDWQHRQDD